MYLLFAWRLGDGVVGFLGFFLPRLRGLRRARGLLPRAGTEVEP